jgi:spectinomycin phosphotransferase
LADAVVVAALHEAWDLDADDIVYAPVGFGSYHWHVTAACGRWFVTVDDLGKHGNAPTRAEPAGPAQPDSGRLLRLEVALSTARALRDAGFEFVVAPRRTSNGAIVQVVDGAYAVALYPHVDGDVHDWGPYPSRRDRLDVLDLVAALHAAPASVRRHAVVDDLTIPHRDELAAALDERDKPWDEGPFGEPARALVTRHADAVARALGRYDRLASRVARTAGRRDRLVVTHGEPHRGNTITTSSGVVLIDWDTTLVAPPERDLWALAAEDPQVLADYTDRTGTVPDADALDLYGVRWTLTDVAIFVRQFRGPHDDDEDTRIAWDGLNRYLVGLAEGAVSRAANPAGPPRRRRMRR